MRYFDAAKKQYDQITLETKDIQPYQQIAAGRLTMLPRMTTRPIFGKPPTLPDMDGLGDEPHRHHDSDSPCAGPTWPVPARPPRCP